MDKIKAFVQTPLGMVVAIAVVVALIFRVGAVKKVVIGS